MRVCLHLGLCILDNYKFYLYFQAAALPKGAKVEIEAIAVVGEIHDEEK